MAVSFNQMNSYPVAGQNLQKAKNAQQTQVAAQTIVQDSYSGPAQTVQTAQNVAQTPPNASFKGSSASAETKPLSLGQGAAVVGSCLLGCTAGVAGGYLHARDTMPFFKDGVPSDEFVKLYTENLTKHESQTISAIKSQSKKFVESLNDCKSGDELISFLKDNIFKNYKSLKVDNAKKSVLELFGGILDEQSKSAFKNVKTFDELETFCCKELNSTINAKGLESVKNEFSKLSSYMTDEALAKFQLMAIFDSKKNGFRLSPFSQDGAALDDTIHHFCRKPAFIWGAVGAAVLGGATMLYCYFKNKSAAPETQKLDAKV